MKVSMSSSDISGEVEAPPSKSYTHRAVVVGCLSGEVDLLNPLKSDDIEASVRCARRLGAEIQEKEDKLEIEGTRGKPETPERVLDCGNSGTTLRLFAGVSSLCDGFSVLTGDESLRERPNWPLLSSIQDLGGFTMTNDGDASAPLLVKGPIRGGETRIDGSVSSQFISSLLFVTPLTQKGAGIEVKGVLKSRPYVDITLEVLGEMGIEYEETDSGFRVEGDQSYESKEFQVPGDFSSASYPLAAGALQGEVKVKNLYPGPQGDRRILELLDRMGADVSWDKEEGVAEVFQQDLKGIEFDASNNPDLVPTLAVLGAKGSGKTRITNVKHLRYKETDRLEALATELSKMNVDIEEGEDYLLVDGDESKLQGAEVDGRGDHRIVMALAIAALAANGKTTIDTAESVEISYPGFFEDLSSLGASVETFEDKESS